VNRHLSAWVALGLASSACKQEEVAWVAFNGEVDAITIEVGPDLPLGELVTADLTSTTGVSVVGDVIVNPSSGPVGTVHAIDLTVLPSYEEMVTRVEVEISSTVRNPVTYPLVQDSADLGRWVLSLTSYGEAEEARVDTLTFRLYELVAVVEAEDEKNGLFGL
jgi:hypothetical protein